MKKRTPMPRPDYRICVYLDKETWDAVHAMTPEETSTSSVIRKLINAKYQQTHQMQEQVAV